MVLIGSRPIKGYDGYYISPSGSVLGRKGYQLKPWKYGEYYVVKLYKGSKTKVESVHRLVATYFVDGYREGLEVNHKDGNKENNLYTNLEWVTSQRNTEHAVSKHYDMIDPQGNVVHIFNMANFCREHNLNNGHMFQVALGKEKQHKGWRRYEGKRCN